MDLRTYLLGSLAGRGGKYVLETLLVLVIGEAARSLTEPQLYGLIAAATVVVIRGSVFRRYWLPPRFSTLGGDES